MPEPVTIIAVGGGAIAALAQFARQYFDLAKEIMDIVLGFCLLVLALPVLLVCGILIKLSSPGPVIYTQVRLGKGGKPFRMYKLRTMHVNCDSIRNNPTWTLRADPRIIPACRWMRSSHIDELPQLINVVKGDMSLVGPRPERPEIVEELVKVYPDFRKRLAVRPGITGLAQIRSGYNGSLAGAGTKLVSDLEYIKQRKWALELRILAATLTKLRDRETH